MSKIYETTIELNAALGRQYAQTFAAAQKLTNGLNSELIDMQTTAANASGLAGLGDEIQKLSSEMDASGGGTDEQKNRIKYLTNEYSALSQELYGSVLAFSEAAENASILTDTFEAQEIAAKDLAQTQQALEDVEGVVSLRKEVERLNEMYESMPNKELASHIKEQEKALKRLEGQTGLTGRSMSQLENRYIQLISRSEDIKASQEAVQKEIKKTEAWNKFKKNASSALGSASKGAAVLAKGMATAMKAIGAAMAAGVTAAGVFAHETAQKLEETEQRARQFGMDTDIFQGFEYSMKKNGVERDQYIDGLQTLQERMFEATKEPGEMRDNFAKLGITMDDLKSKNVGEIFEQMAGNAHMLGSEAEQTKMGLDMLGGEGGKIMAAMAKEGIAGMQKDFDEAKRMGAIATKEQIQNSLKYQEQVAKMGAAWEGVKMTVGNAVMPIFTKLMDKVGTWLEENPDTIKKIGEGISNIANNISNIFMNYIVPYIGPTIEFFKEWGPLIAGIAATIAGFVVVIKAITVATAIWNAVIAMNPIVLIIMAVIAAIALVAYFVVKYWDEIKAIWNACVETFANGLKSISNAFNAAITWIKETWQKGVDYVAAGIGWLVSAFLSIPDKISALGSTLATFFSGIWDGIKQTFINMINWVIGKINSISFTVPDWVPEIGGSTVGMNIPLLANGGIATKATPAIIGEGSEPEAVLPLSKLKSLMGGTIGGISLTINQNINLDGDRNVEAQAKRGASAGAQDLAAQIDAIMKRKYRLAM